jgi:glycosyltransferase involved in cell wall biosynthesis
MFVCRTDVLGPENLMTGISESVGDFDNAGGDVVCFSHLRWDFVYQRPQHLMSRCAQDRRVFFFEEPIFENGLRRAYAERRMTSSGVTVIVPKFPSALGSDLMDEKLRIFVDDLFGNHSIKAPILWYYTPMALLFTRHLNPALIVYDCMDELSGFRNAPPEIRDLENELLTRSDIVFVGGVSLYEAKEYKHKNIYAFPSSIDALHFAAAREVMEIPPDECEIPRPRLGFAGVIDERMNLNLINQIAQTRPDWHIVLIGPVAKLNPDELPQNPNIHYLGMKPYSDLPSYMAGWDVAIIPFAHNKATQFISPTKTPEYLAAGLPVISTSVRDVVRTYGSPGFVHIADTAEEFIVNVDRILSGTLKEDKDRLDRIDNHLAENSWDRTWDSMMDLIQKTVEQKTESPTLQVPMVGESDV